MNMLMFNNATLEPETSKLCLVHATNGEDYIGFLMSYIKDPSQKYWMVMLLKKDDKDEFHYAAVQREYNTTDLWVYMDDVMNELRERKYYDDAHKQLEGGTIDNKDNRVETITDTERRLRLLEKTVAEHDDYINDLKKYTIPITDPLQPMTPGLPVYPPYTPYPATPGPVSPWPPQVWYSTPVYAGIPYQTVSSTFQVGQEPNK